MDLANCFNIAFRASRTPVTATNSTGGTVTHHPSITELNDRVSDKDTVT